MKKKLIDHFRYSICLAIFLFVQGHCHADSNKKCLLKNELIKEVWNQIQDYFLPDDHPAKHKIDQIFSKRVTENLNTLAASGFIFIQAKRIDKVIVCRHPELPGYIIKTFIDDTSLESALCDRQLVKRAIGSRLMKDTIEHQNLQGLFKVPQKWLYVLPDETNKCKKKILILIEEDMGIAPNVDDIWKSENISYELLNALFSIISMVDLNDIKPKNIPFCMDGKFAFIDTAGYHKSEPNFYKFGDFLNPTMKLHWDTLCEQHAK